MSSTTASTGLSDYQYVTPKKRLACLKPPRGELQLVSKQMEGGIKGYLQNICTLKLF
jgi:hypothetical protein